ncbi:hypothetical protein BH09PLA1_BH09PLA1_01480 [soil metagenome]
MKQRKFPLGRRAILFVRSATDDAPDLAEQRRVLTVYARCQRLHVVDEVGVDGVSQGSLSTGTAAVLDGLITRKIHVDDFDILLMRDLSRITRSGVHHAIRTIMRLTNVGITVVTSDQGPIDKSMLRTFKFDLILERRDDTVADTKG